MKLFVKRDKYKTFEKAKIEIASAREWTLLSSGLRARLESDQEALEFFKSIQIERNEDHTDTIQQLSEGVEQIKGMLNVLDYNNELVWK